MNFIHPNLFQQPLLGDFRYPPGSQAAAIRLPDQTSLSAELYQDDHRDELIARIFQGGFVPPRWMGDQGVKSMTELTWKWIQRAFPQARDDAECESSLSRALSLLAPESFEHSARVCLLAERFAYELGASPDEQEDLRRSILLKECGIVALQVASWSEEERDLAADLIGHAGAFHDIGKLAVASEILNKPGPLTPDERALMNLHPLIGESMLEPLASAYPILPAVRHHHERWDGHGYVDGLAGEAIPMLARIIALSDSLDAMTEGRPYQGARTSEEACQELLAGAGRQFDPYLCTRFVDMVRRG
jgi:HD-GYP domain-containing protein (c-di-GMP phosphodiesterase class II)